MTQLKTLLNYLKGSFLLSSYRSEQLKEAVAAHCWHNVEIKMSMAVAKGHQKIEVLTANYPISL